MDMKIFCSNCKYYDWSILEEAECKYSPEQKYNYRGPYKVYALASERNKHNDCQFHTPGFHTPGLTHSSVINSILFLAFALFAFTISLITFLRWLP